MVLKQYCEHLVIAGRSYEKARGDALDLQHTLAFCSRPMLIEACTNKEVMDADIILITASVAANGQILTSRMQLGNKNIAMFRELIPMLATNNPNALLVS